MDYLIGGILRTSLAVLAGLVAAPPGHALAIRHDSYGNPSLQVDPANRSIEIGVASLRTVIASRRTIAGIAANLRLFFQVYSIPLYAGQLANILKLVWRRSFSEDDRGLPGPVRRIASGL